MKWLLPLLLASVYADTTTTISNFEFYVAKLMQTANDQLRRSAPPAGTQLVLTPDGSLKVDRVEVIPIVFLCCCCCCFLVAIAYCCFLYRSHC